VMCSLVMILMAPIILTYVGAQYLRRLIVSNRMIEARRLSHSLMSTSLTFFPYSALFSVAVMQMDIMRRDAAFHELNAISRVLRGAIEKFPYSKFTKSRLLPIFDNYQGIASLGLGDYEEARRLFNECLPGAIGLNKAMFLNNVGVCNLRLGHYEDAHKEFSEAIATFPPKSKLQLGLSCFYPNLARACVRLSRLEEASRLLEKSMVYFESVKEDNMLRAGFYGTLGLLKAAEGHLDEAEQHMRSAIELQHQFDDLSPNVQETRIELAIILERLGKNAEAEALRKLVAENTLKLQLRHENASDELLHSLSAGTHPIALLGK
jgi:tetratricopeptide (TPR) repeat protein